MIQFASDTDVHKSTLKRMWQQCFPLDSEQFINFYFDNIYKNDETLIYIEDGKIVASLQIIPYSIKIQNTIHASGYISGLMTLSDYRKKGYMDKLLKSSFEMMQEKGYDYTFLIPQENWLVKFYEKYKYHLIENDIDNTPHTTPSMQYTSCTIYSTPYSVGEECYHIYSCFLKEKPNVVLKNKSQFIHILWDFFNEGGTLFTGNQGIAFTFRQKDKIIIKEFFYRNENIKNYFLRIIQQHYNLNEIIFSRPTNQGMVKTLNPLAGNITNLYINMMLD